MFCLPSDGCGLVSGRDDDRGTARFLFVVFFEPCMCEQASEGLQLLFSLSKARMGGFFFLWLVHLDTHFSNTVFLLAYQQRGRGKGIDIRDRDDNRDRSKSKGVGCRMYLEMAVYTSLYRVGSDSSKWRRRISWLSRALVSVLCLLRDEG